MKFTNAKVGDKYLLPISVDGGVEMIVDYISKDANIVVLTSGTHEDMAFNLEGLPLNNKEPNLTPKPKERPWLKEIPDAGIFADAVSFIFFDTEFQGWAFGFENPEFDTRYLPLKMPKLTEDQWAGSLIYINELKEWQEKNKAIHHE